MIPYQPDGIRTNAPMRRPTDEELAQLPSMADYLEQHTVYHGGESDA